MSQFRMLEKGESSTFPPPTDTTPAVTYEMAGTAANAKRIAVEDPIEKRVRLLAGVYTEPLESKYAVTDIHMAAIAYAKELQSIFKRSKVDTGRAIAALDAVKQSYSLATDAIILPCVKSGDDNE